MNAMWLVPASANLDVVGETSLHVTLVAVGGQDVKNVPA
jgi:hypothetical protein